ncbi:MAG TPA: tetratricopeptide repeat protein, partial [Kineosporiaceae bacterium]|nr:tetratricopeptide repeat protein [Kineosporiaceae bacterium]
DTETVSDALRNLQRLSLAVVDPATAMLRVHALVQRVTREGWSPEECESVARVAADALTAVWLSVPQHSAEHHVVRNNAVALRKSTGNLLLAGGAHPILVAIGQSLLANGLFPSARTFLTEMRADAEGVLGADHRDTLIITKHLATSVGRCGDLGQAAGMFRELLPQMESTFGASHRETLSVRASILYWDGWANLEGTVAGLQAVVEEQIRTLGHDDADVFLSRHDLARWHARAGRPAQAAVLMRGLWDDQARVLGAGHADVIDTRNDLARFLGWSGAVDEAVRVAADLLPDSVAQLGPFHPLTVNVRHNLAHWKGEAGEPGEAAAELRTSLEQFAAVLGEEHSETFMARTLLGDWLGRAGQTGEAIDTLQQLLEDQRRIVGDRHPDTIRTGLKLDFWRRHHEAGPGAPPVTYEPYASWSEVFTSEERSER